MKYEYIGDAVVDLPQLGIRVKKGDMFESDVEIINCFINKVTDDVAPTDTIAEEIKVEEEKLNELKGVEEQCH
jgi:hypothetical protein